MLCDRITAVTPPLSRSHSLDEAKVLLGDGPGADYQDTLIEGGHLLAIRPSAVTHFAPLSYVADQGPGVGYEGHPHCY